MNHYNGFNYEEFYEFIVDFFEEDQTPEGTAAAKELLGWWNLYGPDFPSGLFTANSSLDVFFRGPPPPEPPRSDQQDDRRSQFCDDSAKRAPNNLNTSSTQ